MAGDITTGMPDEAAAAYREALAEAKTRGLADDVAANFAARKLRQAGWYLGAEGWKQLAPDVREKVNLRQAVPQPDGKFLIEDVDVFYPNAAKGPGDEKKFNAERNRLATDNTNRSIAAGGPAPALTKGHPDFKMNRALGVQLPSFGSPINFRESPRGEGWVRADLSAVDPAMVQDWKAGRYVGLSVGFVSDANETNLRIGHVAALGAEAQALSQLPALEVFASDCVCFAADAAFFANPNVKGKPMNKHYAAFKACHSAYAAAFASAEAGEPGAVDKLKEAQANFKAARAAFAADNNPDAGADEKLIKEVLAEEGVKPTATAAPAEVARKADEMPKEPVGKTDEQFGALQTQVGSLKSQLDQSEGERKMLRQTVAAMEGQRRLVEFTAYLTSLTSKGHQFSAETAVEQFKMFADNEGALALLRKQLEASPVKPVMPTAGPIFGADGATPIGGDKEPSDAEVQRIIRKYAPAAQQNSFGDLGNVGL